MSRPRRRSSFSSPLLDLPFLILLLSIIAFLIFFFVAILPFISSSSRNKLKPNITVKKSWDSLNIFLVLFAILCGIFARRNDDDSASSSSYTEDVNNTNRNVSDSNHKQERHSASNNWFDQFAPGTPSTAAVSGFGRLKRSSSSYPDLRQDNLWESGDDTDRFRFFDDFEIIKNGYPATSSSSQYIYHRRQRSLFEESNVKEIPVDTYILRSSSFPSPSPPSPPKSPAPPPPPPPPPPPVVRNHKQKRTYKTVARQEKAERAVENEFELSNIRNPPPPPPPPPPRLTPPPPIMKTTRSERKKNNTTKELKMVLISLYHQSKKKKKQKTRSLHNNETLHSPPPSQFSTVPPPSPTPPPPPPPLPPPLSMFHNLFRKGTKSKRIHSFSAPPPPPPPPPRPSSSASKSWSKLRSHISAAAAAPPPPPPPPPAPPTPPRAPYRRRSSTATGRPPIPTRANNWYEENVNNGGQSPVIPMPPPPPPPPFRVPGFKFTVKGDYVKISSVQSSRCSSPELDEMDRRSTKTVNQTEGGDGNRGSAFCPSLDVNAKADTFIARLRGEWRLEKINSLKEKRSMGRSQDDGPISGPSTL